LIYHVNTAWRQIAALVIVIIKLWLRCAWLGYPLPRC